MQLHRERGNGELRNKKARPQSMPTLEALAQARLDYMGERARLGAIRLMNPDKAVLDLVQMNDVGNVLGFQSGVVSSSLNLVVSR